MTDTISREAARQAVIDSTGAMDAVARINALPAVPAALAEAQLRKAIAEGMKIATLTSIEEVPAAIEIALATLAKGADTTEYERKVAQMKEDFPNGI